MRNAAIIGIYLLCSGLLLFIPGIASSFGLIKGLYLMLGMMTLSWILSLIMKDAGIMDIIWGPAIFLMLLGYAWDGQQLSDVRDWVLIVMVFLWAARLAIHIARKGSGKPEDWRYQNWRSQYGKKWWWFSFLHVFLLQGLLFWGLSQLFPLSLYSIGEDLVLTDYIGIILWLIGMFFEVVGDHQLEKFKRSPNRKASILQTGLWRYTRHPNYFGEALIWWGLWFFTLQSGYGLLFIIHPLMMTYLLVYVSGVKMTEEEMSKREGYKKYMKQTSSFFPLPPKGKGT